VGRLTKLEMAIMEVLWTYGPASVREIYEQFPRKGPPGINSLSTVAARMKGKGLIAVAGKAGNANIYQAAISRADVASDRHREAFAARGRGGGNTFARRPAQAGQALDYVGAGRALRSERSCDESASHSSVRLKSKAGFTVMLCTVPCQ
jgi:predicted transcriptional regulator